MKDYAAIDPMAIILTEDAYLIWCEIHHPQVLKVPGVKELFERMNKEQKKHALLRAKTLMKYGQMLVEFGKAVEVASLNCENMGEDN
jgi:hypothetical protein